jgi:hypothetical protein
MNYRKAVMLSAESIATAGVKTLDFKGKDVISRIMIQPKLLNSTNTPTAHPATAISKIEIVDGSDVLWSLSGKEAQALNFYQMGLPAFDIMNYINDEYCAPTMIINFGRWLWDEDLAFDPTRFNNPQLKITHNLAAGGGAPDAGTLEVVADTFDEIKPNPMGWLMAKEYYTYSLTSSAYEYIDLPTDHMLRMLLIKSLAAGKQPHEQFNEIRLSEDNDKRIPIDESTSDLAKYILDQFGRYRENVRATMTTADVTHYITPAYMVNAAGMAWDAEAAYISAHLSYGGTITLKASAAAQVNMMIDGYCPHGVFPLPFGDLWDANKWYDATKLKDLELRIKAGSSVGSSSTAEIITEQLRRY